jgi:hypothetical protein
LLRPVLYPEPRLPRQGPNRSRPAASAILLFLRPSATSVAPQPSIRQNAVLRMDESRRHDPARRPRRDNAEPSRREHLFLPLSCRSRAAGSPPVRRRSSATERANRQHHLAHGFSGPWTHRGAASNVANDNQHPHRASGHARSPLGLVGRRGNVRQDRPQTTASMWWDLLIKPLRETTDPERHHRAAWPSLRRSWFPVNLLGLVRRSDAGAIRIGRVVHRGERGPVARSTRERAGSVDEHEGPPN